MSPTDRQLRPPYRHSPPLQWLHQHWHGSTVHRCRRRRSDHILAIPKRCRRCTLIVCIMRKIADELSASILSVAREARQFDCRRCAEAVDVFQHLIGDHHSGVLGPGTRILGFRRQLGRLGFRLGLRGVIDSVVFSLSGLVVDSEFAGLAGAVSLSVGSDVTAVSRDVRLLQELSVQFGGRWTHWQLLSSSDSQKEQNYQPSLWYGRRQAAECQYAG